MNVELIEQIKTIATAENNFIKNSKIFNAGERVAQIHFLKKSEAHLIKKNTNLLINRYAANTILAEASLFSETYHCSCIAASKCESISLSKSSLLKHLNGNPRLAYLGMEYLSTQIMQARDFMAILGMKTVRERFNAFKICTQA